jgi:P4 family phage/plasmid primase-like protien
MSSIAQTQNGAQVQAPSGPAEVLDTTTNDAHPDAATFAVATFAHCKDKKPYQQFLTWREIIESLTAHTIRPKKDGACFSPALYPPNTTRAKENVQAVSCLLLDFDDDDPPDELTAQWQADRLAHVIYSTHSHTPDKAKWRALFPLAAPVAAAQWESVYRKSVQALANGKTDPSCKDASRIYYLPSCPPEYSDHAFAFAHDGAALDPDQLPDPAPQEPQRAAFNRSTPIPATDKIHRRYVASALEKELDKLRAAANGDRNNQLNKSAHALGQLAGAGVLDRAAIESELAATAAAIGLPASEAARTIQSGLNAGEREPRQLPQPRLARLLATSKPIREVTADEIPAPSLQDDKGNPEYDPAQLVRLLHPSWPVQNLATHAAHAQRIRDHIGDDLCYSPNLGWLVYNARCWQRDDKHATKTSARVAKLTQAVRDEAATLYHFAAILAQAGRASDVKAMSKAATALLRHTKQVESKAFIEGALHLAAGLLAVETEQFDQKPWVIGFQNGTWDRDVWREHRREDYLLHLSPVTLDFDSNRDEWLATLDRITAADLDFALMAQDVAGYILSAASHLRLLPFFYGPKGTGKSTFAELLQTVLGDMAATIDPKKLQDSAARERLGADLWNRRLAVCSEAGSQRLEAELLKTLSGSDRLAVRFLFREAFTAPPRHVLLMVTNDPPRMDAYDAALKDRVIALPFNHPLDNGAPLQLTGGKRIEAVRQDHESPLVRGFAAWAVEGLSRVWQSQEIHRAACAATATAQFWSDTDQLTPFWETIEEAELFDGIGKTELRKRYENWCETEGARPFNRSQWARACKSHGLSEGRSTDGNTRLWFLTQLTQLSTFSKDTREAIKVPRIQIENTASCVSCVSDELEEVEL